MSGKSVDEILEKIKESSLKYRNAILEFENMKIDSIEDANAILETYPVLLNEVMHKLGTKGIGYSLVVHTNGVVRFEKADNEGIIIPRIKV